MGYTTKVKEGMKKTSQRVSFVKKFVHRRPVKKICGRKVGVYSAKVDRGRNKVKKAHMSVMCEKSSLETDVLFGW